MFDLHRSERSNMREGETRLTLSRRDMRLFCSVSRARTRSEEMVYALTTRSNLNSSSTCQAHLVDQRHVNPAVCAVGELHGRGERDCLTAFPQHSEVPDTVFRKQIAGCKPDSSQRMHK
eukprot:746463-Hanusia_phi.AAC.5